MHQAFAGGVRGWLVVGVAVLTIGGLALAASPEDKAPTQTAGVDNTKTGPYRALAQLSFQAFQKGENATVATLARVLERTWDMAEGGGGERSLGTTNPDQFKEIDEAMDVYIKPVMYYAPKAPDAAKVEAA